MQDGREVRSKMCNISNALLWQAILRGPKVRESKTSVKSFLLILPLDWICGVNTSIIVEVRHCEKNDAKQGRSWNVDKQTKNSSFLNFCHAEWKMNDQLLCQFWCRNSKIMVEIYLRAKIGCAQFQHIQSIISRHQDFALSITMFGNRNMSFLWCESFFNKKLSTKRVDPLVLFIARRAR